MSDELSTVPTELTTLPDVCDDLELIATSPAEMQVAQGRLVEWCDQKISIVQRDADELAENLKIAKDNGWKTATFDRQHKVALGRVAFYVKCKEALAAGFCIVPNFPIDVFAIRTRRTAPKPDMKPEKGLWSHQQSSEINKLGAGEFQNPDPNIASRNLRTGEYDKTTHEPKTIKQYFAESYQEIEFPISVCKPRIMSETQRAMALKCFDDVGVLPARKGRGDPVVIGRIHRTGGTVSFLIAWYVNTRDL